MMKKLVATLFFLALILVAAALIAPGFIDWSQHKEGILNQLKPYLGRKIEVAGQVKFRLVPNPEILLEDVTLSNAEGAKADNFMKLKQLQASMKFQPLLQGRFEVEAINLEEPELDLETLDDGSNNWTGILKQREEGASGLENAVQFNQITMTNGTLHYLNQVTGAEVELDKLNLTVSADTLFGPYRVAGDMQYKGSQVSVNVATGKFGSGEVPLKATLTPVENLPLVRLDGTMDTSGGLNVKGNLFISQGNVASLFDSDFIRNIAFLNDETDLSGDLDLKGGQMSLSDIKAKFGRRGDLSGSVSVSFEKGKKPAVTVDIAGSNLKVAAKSGFMAVPDGFDAHLKLKGKNIVWDGTSLYNVTLAADTDKDGWAIKSGRFDLPGKSVAKISGIATPKTKYASYSVQVNTEDLSALLKALPLGDGNFLKTVGDSGLIKKLDWSSSLDLRPDKASLSDIDARIADKMKVSGVLDVMPGQTPAYKATLNLDDADMAVFPADGWKAFTTTAVKSDGSAEISAKNLAKDELKLSDLSLAAETGEAGLHIKDMSGAFADGGAFKVTGTVASLDPATGLDVEYNLKTQAPGAVAKALGITLPPPLKAGAPVDIHGHVGGEARKYTFNAEGHGLHMIGAAETGADGAETYQTTLHVELPDGGVLAMLGVPVDKLLGSPKDLSGELSGTRSNYKIAKLDAGGVTGWLARKDEKYSGELSATTLDFDNWLSDAWAVKDPVSLKLIGKKLIWRNDEVDSPAATLDAVADGLDVNVTGGKVWDGDLTAEVSGKRAGDKWSGSMKGHLKGADLSRLAALMEFKGFSVGTGDLDFNLSSSEAQQDKEWFHGIDGDLGMKAHELTVTDFAPAAMPDLIASYKGKPEDFTAAALKALGSGDTKYDDVDAAFKVGGGKVDLSHMMLRDASGTVDVKGSWDLSPDTYHVSAEVKLTTPEDAPGFSVSRSGPLKNAPDYSINAAQLLDYIAKRNAQEEPKPSVTPAGSPVLKPGEQAAQPTAEEHPAPEAKEQQGPPRPPETKPSNPAENQKPVQLTPPPEAAPAEAPPPALPTPADVGGNGGRIDEPIETEPLAAPPAPPAPPLPPIPAPSPVTAPAPPPAEQAAPNGPANPAIKGILDRLNDGSEKNTLGNTDKMTPPPSEAPPAGAPGQPQ